MNIYFWLKKRIMIYFSYVNIVSINILYFFSKSVRAVHINHELTKKPLKLWNWKKHSNRNISHAFKLEKKKKKNRKKEKLIIYTFYPLTWITDLRYWNCNSFPNTLLQLKILAKTLILEVLKTNWTESFNFPKSKAH